MKTILKIIKLNIQGGQANPSAPIGPSLGAVGVNIMDFCNKFNKITKVKTNEILPVIINVYNDKSFDFKIKKESIKTKIFYFLNIKKGSNEPNKKKIGNINIEDVKNIAKYKMSDLNCFKTSSAISMIIGTLKTIGINIIYNNEKKNKYKKKKN
ncbi:MAG: 50S ribosomal protein L11 [Candidatus Shikimatogenerans bostrichidophilus]|nr:MAG: 50S ribosomal protein L11 [Candidatus Shikimatogenerans bostrichidophilus]